MVNTDRSRRVSELLRRELAMLVAREINDSRIRQISISRVRVSKDLKHATIYFSSLNSALAHLETGICAKDTSHIESVLNRAAGFFRHRLSQQAELRVIPDLRFRYDDSIQKGVEMSHLIDRLNRKND